MGSKYFFFTPSYEILSSFLSFKNFFFGGLFLTLTTGIFLITISFFAGIIYLKFRYKKTFLIFSITILALFLVFISKAYILFILIPFFVFFITVKLQPKFKIDLVVVLPLLIAIFSPLLYQGETLFLDVRDKVLLTSSYGKRINNFYYKYTLFPAEVVKSLKQKNLKTFCTKNIKNSDLEILKKKMKRHNFFHMEKNCDLKIKFKNNRAAIYLNDAKAVEMDKSLIFDNTKKVLNQLYKKTDPKKIIKNITYAGFLTGFPFIVYFFFFNIINLFISLFLKGKKSLYLTSFILLLIFSFTFKPVFFHKKIDNLNFDEKIISSDKFERLDALKFAFKNKINIKNIEKHIKSKYVPQRYWAILNFEVKSLNDLQTIFKMTKDESINIRCKAYEKLSDIRNNKVLKSASKNFLVKDYPKIKDWYVQWYAYNSTKKLGLY